jgi:alanyl-tRNA synthetase
MTVHRICADTSFPVSELKKPLTAHVNADLRNHTRRNHSATHLLQAALRSVLGDHVQQSGSRVGPDSLRFDFTHFKALSSEELSTVEKQVNEWILADLPVATDIQDTESAKKQGAMALFGEKYGEKVRVVSMGRVSKELCGGTHVASTGQIGLFHIATETSIAAGVRRIEAITGMNSVGYLESKARIIEALTGALKVSEDALVERISTLLDKIKSLEADMAKLSKSQAGDLVQSIIAEAQQADASFRWAVKHIGSLDKKDFGAVTNVVSDTIRQKNLADMVVVLGAVSNGGVLFAACAGETAAREHGIHCGDIVRKAAQIAGGNGGGSPTRAQAGGKNEKKIDEALDAARAFLKQKAASQ